MSKYDNDYQVMKVLYLEYFQKIEKENEELKKKLSEQDKIKTALMHSKCHYGCGTTHLSKKYLAKLTCENCDTVEYRRAEKSYYVKKRIGVCSMICQQCNTKYKIEYINIFDIFQK